MIDFRLDPRSGVPTYRQLVHQVRQALRVGLLSPGDQLPTAKEVVGRLAINPNTVLKAYSELEHEGLVATRQGQGTFVVRDLPGPRVADLRSLRRRLHRWLQEAEAAGLDDESIDALIATARRDLAVEDIA
ncbi:MAG: GntR family transcriptional regulator [Candidatus Dormibacteria bacterium]